MPLGCASHTLAVPLANNLRPQKLKGRAIFVEAEFQKKNDQYMRYVSLNFKKFSLRVSQNYFGLWMSFFLSIEGDAGISDLFVHANVSRHHTVSPPSV